MIDTKAVIMMTDQERIQYYNEIFEDIYTEGGNNGITYNKCKILADGGICVYFSNGARVMINKNTLDSKSTNLFGYGPGDSSTKGLATHFDIDRDNNNVMDGIISQPKNSNDTVDHLDLGMQVADALGIEVNSVVDSGWSMGGAQALRQSEHFLNKYGDNPNLSFSVFLSDATPAAVKDIEKIQILTEKQIPIIVTDRDTAVYDQLIANGYNAIYLYGHREHGEFGDDMRQFFRTGNFDEFKEYTRYIENNYIGQYVSEEYMLYNPETGQMVAITPEIYDKYLSSYFSFLNGGEKSHSDYKIETSKSDSLKLKNGTYEEGTVISDIAVIMNNINNISSSLKKYDNEPINTSVCNGLGDVMQLSSLFTGISADLNNGINNELSLICSIAQQYYNLDAELASNVTNRLDTINTKLLETYNGAKNGITKFNKNVQLTWLSNNNSNIEFDVSSINTTRNAFKNYCDNEFQNADEIIKQISAFETDLKSKLKGDVWAKIGTRMAEYKNLQEERKIMADKLNAAINTYLTTIENYMTVSPPPPAGCTSLSTTKLNSLKEDVINLYSLIENANYIVNAKEYRTYETESTNIFGKKIIKEVSELVYVFDEATRNVARENISKWEKELKEIEEMITKIEGLPNIVNEAKKHLDETLTQINGEYGCEVDSVITGNASSYSYQSTMPSNIKVSIGESELDKELAAAREKNSQINSFYNDEQKIRQFGTYENYKNGIKLRKQNSKTDKTYVDGILKDADYDKKKYEGFKENIDTDFSQEETEQLASDNQANKTEETKGINPSVQSETKSASNETSNNGTVAYNHSYSKSTQQSNKQPIINSDSPTSTEHTDSSPQRTTSFQVTEPAATSNNFEPTVSINSNQKSSEIIAPSTSETNELPSVTESDLKPIPETSSITTSDISSSTENITMPTDNNSKTKTESNVLGTVAAIGAVGAVSTAAAVAGSKYIKKKKENNEV